MKKLFFTILLLTITNTIFSQNVTNSNNCSNLEILVSTGEIVKDLFVLKKAPSTDTIAAKVLNAANTTFIGQSATLFNYVQNYLFKQGNITEIEPARLAITNRQGCFGVMGFVLEENGEKIEKLNSGYVDLYKGMFSRDYNHLESITQLFPHEMGHVIQMYLCTDLKNFAPESKSPNIHYFNLTTCYNTAFSEGFAEHFENIARKMEPSEKVKIGIFKDIENKRKDLPRYIKGFDRDFKLPLRIGFYRSITPLWYQQLENLKRYDLVENGQIKYVNSTMPNASLSDAILYRNTGVAQNQTKIRNAAQAASTEGVISAFFSGLVLSPLNEKYLPVEFYQPFVTDTLTAENLKQRINPLQNEYMKIFKVMHSYVKTNATSRGQLFDFVDGYCKDFPEETSQIMEILNKTTGISEIPESLPEIWILHQNMDHKFWVMAQFGLSIPYYAFNLNAADSLDFITFKDISAEDASKIIKYREQNGFFQSINEIKNISNISDEAKLALITNEYNEKNVPTSEGRPNFMSLLYLPLLHMVGVLLIWFAFILAIYLFLIRKMEFTIWRRTMKALRQFLKFLLLGLIALICLALFSYSWKLFIAIGLVIIGLKAIILHKKKPELRISLIVTTLMIIVILYSII